MHGHAAMHFQQALFEGLELRMNLQIVTRSVYTQDCSEVMHAHAEQIACTF